MFNKGSYFYLTIVAAAAVLVFIKIFTADTAVVFISDEKFEPQHLQIAAGTKVIFKNIGNNFHWPASNFHPTHKSYPETGGCIGSKLDACKGLAANETYEFVFNQTGSWSLHDHLHPGLTMVIDVGSTSVNQSASIDPLDPVTFRSANYSQQIKIMEDRVDKDPAEAWQFLKTVFFVDGQVLGNAHEFAHQIGNGIYDRYKLPGIQYCDATFAFGCYHGVSEKLLMIEGSSGVKATQDECLKIFPPAKDMNYTGCIHGMGHGLLTWRNLDIRLALADCDILDQPYWNYCYDGMFMENSSEVPEQAANLGDLWKLCKSLDARYHYNCARFQAEAIRILFNSDIRKTAEACLEATESLMVKSCLESLGYYVSQIAKDDIIKAQSMCGQIKDSSSRTTCITAAARETIFQQYGDWQGAAQKLCDSLSSQDRTNCLASNEAVKRQYNR